MNALLLNLACIPLLVAVAWSDIRVRRIPNALVVTGLAIGLALHGLHPFGIGIGLALAGMALGFAAFLPLHLLRAMGAGDVKLMAMVGAFLGPYDILGAMLATGLLGGVVALLMILQARALRQATDNLRVLGLNVLCRTSGTSLPILDDLPAPAARLPYGVAIALGTMAYLAWKFHVGGGLS